MRAGLVRWADLVQAAADRFDSIDEAAGRQHPGEKLASALAHHWRRQLCSRKIYRRDHECDALKGQAPLACPAPARRRSCTSTFGERNATACLPLPPPKRHEGALIEHLPRYDVRSALLLRATGHAPSTSRASQQHSQTTTGMLSPVSGRAVLRYCLQPRCLAGDEEVPFRTHTRLANRFSDHQFGWKPRAYAFSTTAPWLQSVDQEILNGRWLMPQFGLAGHLVNRQTSLTLSKRERRAAQHFEYPHARPIWSSSTSDGAQATWTYAVPR